VSGLSSNRKPEYPLAARSRRQEGRVLLRIHVSATGEPVSIGIVSSSGYASLDQAASAAIGTWRFVPASRGGLAVAAHADVPITFRLDD
jgi:protein TonB